jgi:hypothetical protein
MAKEVNYVDGLRNYYITTISTCKCSCLKTIISKTEIQYIIDIISIFKFECEPYGLESDLLYLNIHIK